MDNDFSEKISALLSDPDALSKIMSVAGSLGLASPPPQKSEHIAPHDEYKADAVLKNLSSASPAGKSASLSDTAKSISQSRALLQALKPYLSEERCARIDKILNMMKIAEIMGYLK
jgi:hypothetical protein